MRRTVAVVAVAAALGVTGGTAVAVSQSGGPSSVRAGSPAASTSVPGGSNAGKGGARRGAHADVLRTVLADLVAKGTITQAQADAITKAMADARSSRGADRPREGMGRMFGVLRNTEKAVADAIGITPAQLRDELMKGSTIGEIAKAHGVPESKVVDAVVAQATSLIDRAVSDGHLTADQAEKMKAGIRDLATKLLDGKGFGFGMGFGGDHGGMVRPGRPGAVPPSSSTPAPSTEAPTSVAPPTSATPGPTTAVPTTPAPSSAPTTTS